jgi:hypothetical protein
MDAEAEAYLVTTCPLIGQQITMLQLQASTSFSRASHLQRLHKLSHLCGSFTLKHLFLVLDTCLPRKFDVNLCYECHNEVYVWL